MSFREVDRGVMQGRLFLGAMPGRYGPLEDALGEIERLGIDTVVSLAPREEIEERSPAYAEVLRSSRRGFSFVSVPVEDFGVPEDRESYAEGVELAASLLAEGRRLLVHCGAGIGRTGTFACCLLVALGAAPAESAAKVLAAGSGPETPGQEALVGWFAGRHPGGTPPGENAR